MGWPWDVSESYSQFCRKIPFRWDLRFAKKCDFRPLRTPLAPKRVRLRTFQNSIRSLRRLQRTFFRPFRTLRIAWRNFKTRSERSGSGKKHFADRPEGFGSVQTNF